MLPYSIDVLFAIFGQFNCETWPAPLIFFALALVMLAALGRSGGGISLARAISVCLAIIWAWVGIGFHYIYFAPFNFAASFYAVAFVLQALLFAWAAYKAQPRYRWRRDTFGWAGLILLVYALALYPLVDVGLGHGWQNSRLFAMAPGPTALFTLGLLLLTAGRTPFYLLVVPVGWGMTGGVLAWLLGVPQDAVLPVASLVGVGLAIYKNRLTRLRRERG